MTGQLAVISELHELFRDNGLEYWLFGGWAVDFHAGRITRDHADIDVAVWWDERERVAELLIGSGWSPMQDDGADGYFPYERAGVRLEVAFLARDDSGRVYTPLREGRGEWPDRAFGDDELELLGVRGHVITLGALIDDKSIAHDDPATTAKDRADLSNLKRPGK